MCNREIDRETDRQMMDGLWEGEWMEDFKMKLLPPDPSLDSASPDCGCPHAFFTAADPG